MLESKTIIFEKILEDKEKATRLGYNKLLESAKVGDRPFSKEFYKENLLKAMDQTTSIVVVLGDHLGDATLSLPVITSLYKYFELNSLEDKKITMISSHKDLFQGLRTIYPKLDLLDKAESFHSNPGDKLFCFNLNRKFNDYHALGMETKDGQDPMKVFQHDCQDWIKEVIPVQPGKTKKYDFLPSRIMRNMEMLLGQKLYNDIYSIREFIPKENNFEDQKEKLIKKFSLDKDKPLIIISPGSSAKGKEYPPESWQSLITTICEHKPDIQIFFVDDTDEEKRILYGNMIDHLKKDKAYAIHRGSVLSKEMNALMHMSRLSVTPDTGLGHYSSMCGIPNVMFGLSNSIFWSGPNTSRIIHPYGKTMIRNNALVDLSPKNSKDSFYYGEPENKRGAVDIAPEKVATKVLQILQ